MKVKKSNLRSSISSLTSKFGVSSSIKTASRLASKLPEKEQHLSTKPISLKNSRPASFDMLLTEDELKLVSSACGISKSMETYNSSMSISSVENEDSRLQISKNNRKNVPHASFHFPEPKITALEEEDYEEVISPRGGFDLFNDNEVEIPSSKKLTRGYSMSVKNFITPEEALNNDMKEQAWLYCHQHSNNVTNSPSRHKYGLSYINTNNREVKSQLPSGRKKLQRILDQTTYEPKIAVFSKISPDQIDQSFSAQHFKRFLEENQMALPTMMDGA